SASKAISSNMARDPSLSRRWQHRAMSAPPGSLPLAVLTGLVARVRATPKKTEKGALIANALGQAPGPDAALLALYLTGSLAQGRIGVGWSAVQAALRAAPAAAVATEEPLALADLDRAFDLLAAERGEGSLERRARVLHGLFARTREE